MSGLLRGFLNDREPGHGVAVTALIQLAKMKGLCWSKGRNVGEHIRGIHWGIMFLIMVPINDARTPGQILRAFLAWFAEEDFSTWCLSLAARAPAATAGAAATHGRRLRRNGLRNDAGHALWVKQETAARNLCYRATADSLRQM